jgi:catecholate siderophore receptor
LRVFRRFRSRFRQRAAATGALLAGSLGLPGVEASAAMLPGTGPTHLQESAKAFTFDLPAGPLSDALHAVARITGLEIQVDPARIEGIQCAALTGRFTAEEALRRLLGGTGFGFRFSTASTVVVDFEVAEFVAVSGELPRSASPKLPGDLRDQPQTITVIPAAVIAAQGATTLRDVLRNVPGITFQAGEGGGGLPGDKLTMRGFSADNDIYIDGIRDVGAYTRDAYNVEQVEVIKGPASAIGGRGSTGGAINLATKTPNLTASRSMTLGAGNASYQRGTLDVNQPIEGVKGGSLRVNAMWTDSGYAGRDVVENESWAVAPSLALGLGTGLRATFTYQHLEQDNVPDYGLPWAAFDAQPRVDQSNFYGLRQYDYENIENNVGTAIVEGELAPSLTLRNSTRVGTTVRDSAITAPRPPNRQLQQRYHQTESRANATNLSTAFSTGSLRHAMTSGVEFIREGVLTYNQAQTTNQPPTTLERPDPSDRPLGPLPQNLGTTINDAVTRTVGVYLFDVVDVHPRLQLNGGLRWDRSTVDYEGTTRATGSVLALTHTDRMTSWRAGVVFRPRANGSLYVGYNTAFNPTADAGNAVTALSDQATAANNVNLAPEKTRNLEVGTKWDLLANRLGLTAALFRTEKVNARTRNATNEPFILDGVQRITGVEFGASGSITPAWSVIANLALMDSDIIASRNAAEQGQDFALTPETSLSIWSTYTLPFAVTIGGGVQYQDAVFRNTLNTLAVPSYWLISAMGSYPINHNLTLRLNADNLANRTYVDRVGGGHYIPGPRRTIKIAADLRF